MDYEMSQTISELRKRLNDVEARLAKLEPKPKPNPTIPSLEKARKPTPQERAQERAILQGQAREIEEEERQERLLEREKLGLHGVPPSKNPTTPRRTPAQRKSDAQLGKFHLDDFVTSDDRAIAKQKAGGLKPS